MTKTAKIFARMLQVMKIAAEGKTITERLQFMRNGMENVMKFVIEQGKQIEPDNLDKIDVLFYEWEVALSSLVNSNIERNDMVTARHLMEDLRKNKARLDTLKGPVYRPEGTPAPQPTVSSYRKKILARVGMLFKSANKALWESVGNAHNIIHPIVNKYRGKAFSAGADFDKLQAMGLFGKTVDISQPGIREYLIMNHLEVFTTIIYDLVNLIEEGRLNTAEEIGPYWEKFVLGKIREDRIFENLEKAGFEELDTVREAINAVNTQLGI